MSVTSSGLLETVTGQGSHQLFHMLPLVPEAAFPLVLPGAEVLKLECAWNLLEVQLQILTQELGGGGRESRVSAFLTSSQVMPRPLVLGQGSRPVHLKRYESPGDLVRKAESCFPPTY